MTLTDRQANAIFDVLVRLAGASETQRDQFVDNVDRWTEFRFQGALGFGGKVWNSRGHWYVTAYPEDLDGRPDRQLVIDQTNAELGRLRDDH